MARQQDGLWIAELDDPLTLQDTNNVPIVRLSREWVLEVPFTSGSGHAKYQLCFDGDDPMESVIATAKEILIEAPGKTG